MGGEFVPLVITPGLWKKRGVLAGAYGVVPLPAGELAIAGMIGHEHTCGSTGFAGNLLKHGELVGRYGNVFVDTALDMPAREIAAIGARECAGAESADWDALPVAVVDVGFVFADTRIFERLPERSAPGNFRDFVAQTELRKQRHAH